MRTAILLCLFAVFGNIATAQFTLLPQMGIEKSITTLNYNGLSSFSPACLKPTPMAAIRLDYKFKEHHGPFVGIATNRSIVNFNFADPETGMNTYSATRGHTQMMLEAGWLLSTKRIYANKNSSANKSSKSLCPINRIRNSCGAKVNKAVTENRKEAPQNCWVRIQPSLGVAWIPFTPSAEIITKSGGTQTSYEYNAGNWKTALSSGVGFEFGMNEQQSVMISLNYLKAIGGPGSKTITTQSGNKITNTSLAADASSWTIRMGIPISLGKKKPVKQQAKEQTVKEEKKCGQYKMEYKYRCIKKYNDQ